MTGRLLGFVILLSAAALAVADSLVYPERVVRFTEARDAYVVTLRDEQFRRARVYRTADGTAVPGGVRDRLQKEGATPDGHEPVADFRLAARAGRLLLASGGTLLVSVRENIESSTPDDAAIAVEIQGLEPSVNATITLAELLSADERAQLGRSVSSVGWLRTAWLDESSGQCMIIGTSGRAWAVGLRDGKPKDATDGQLIAALGERKTWDGHFALEVLLGRDHDDRAELLRRLATDDGIPQPLQFHVLAELAAARDVSDAELVALLPHERANWAGLWELAWLSHDRTYPVTISQERRLGALRLLGLAHRSKRDIGVLLHAATDPDDTHAAAAVTALTRRECPDHRDEMRALFVEQPRHARMLAAYYAEHRDDKVVPALVDALERAVDAGDGDTADALVAALRKQTGIDAGKNPDGWRRWLER